MRREVAHVAGVCGLEFDRSDIEMNKLVIGTLESRRLSPHTPKISDECVPNADVPAHDRTLA